jgi:sulfur-oxidizing protein SoxY
VTHQPTRFLSSGVTIDASHSMSRREAILALGGGMLLSVVTLPVSATDEETAAAIKQEYGERVPTPGRVTLTLPPIAESGNSVPLTLAIESPMSEDDRVLRASIFANRNPRPLIATAIFGPKCGRPAFSTNIRLNGTQDVIGIAQMSDLSLWSAQVRVLVTVGACDALQLRY